jgi:YHYH protein
VVTIGHQRAPDPEYAYLMKHPPRNVALAAACLVATACGGESTQPGDDAGTPAPAGQDPPTVLYTPHEGTPITGAARNTAWLCPRPGLAPKLSGSTTPWREGDTINISKLPFVGGTMKWDSQFTMTTTDTERMLVGNGLPNHPTGVYPIEKGTAAYEYYSALPAMGYDNSAEIPIEAYEINLTLPRDPKPNADPTCVHWIFEGVVSQTGGAWHAEIAPDSSLKLHDPISALPLDECWGHPYLKQYHYHAYSWKCFPNQGESGQHSPLFGYAIDGFGVFGPRGESGKLVTNDDLDECHGHTHEIDWDGQKKVMYHYHVNNQYPYTIGCYRGTPIDLPHHLQH